MPISLVSVLVLPVPPRTVKVGSVLLHVTILIVINQSKVSMLLVQSTIRIRTKAQDENVNVKYQMWNGKCAMSSIKYGMSNVK